MVVFFFFFYFASNLRLPVFVSRTFFSARGLDDSFGLQKWNTNVPVFKTVDVCFCYVFGQSQVPVNKTLIFINKYKICVVLLLQNDSESPKSGRF